MAPSPSLIYAACHGRLQAVEDGIDASPVEERRSLATDLAHRALTAGHVKVARLLYNKYGADLTTQELETSGIGMKNSQTLFDMGWIKKSASDQK